MAESSTDDTNKMDISEEPNDNEPEAPDSNSQTEQDEEYDSDDGESEDSEDEEDLEEEPKLRYRRVGGGVRELLDKDAASTLRVTDKFVVRSIYLRFM